ncbi:MAG TPA: ABC transporter ATP-binding protein [Alphaproteobacteria bacterium]|nr:ABC transporter ATP-binding protein [Alphaproteobacteria bacterium]
MDALVQLSDLRRTYRIGTQSVRVLRGITLTIAAGEFVAIVGPSGSGKSTLMNLIGCLDTPTSGSYRLAGEDVGALDVDGLARIRHSRIGFVFQDFHLLPHLDAVDNVALPLAYGAISSRAARTKAADLLAKVGLTNRLRHRPFELSSGQQQRVAIARALINRPSLLLADEPTGALDRRTGLEIMALFQHLNRQGNTIIVVTHDAEIAAMANRRIALVDGALVEDVAVAAPVDAAEALAAQTPLQPPSVACVS